MLILKRNTGLIKLRVYVKDAIEINKIFNIVMNKPISNITDDYALHYEAVIRNAYNCERNGVESANADEYRKLLESYWSLMQCVDNENLTSIKVAKKQFDEKCRTISSTLQEAIGKFEENKDGFEAIRKLLPQTTIHGINIVIDRILEITRIA